MPRKKSEQTKNLELDLGNLNVDAIILSAKECIQDEMPHEGIEEDEQPQKRCSRKKATFISR